MLSKQKCTGIWTSNITRDKIFDTKYRIQSKPFFMLVLITADSVSDLEEGLSPRTKAEAKYVRFGILEIKYQIYLRPNTSVSKPLQGPTFHDHGCRIVDLLYVRCSLWFFGDFPRAKM